MNNDAYNKYYDLADFSYNCISFLIDNNETIWKLLKYPTPDAWNKPNLTAQEKAALVYDGQQDATLSRVFLDSGQPDVWTDQMCIIRISPSIIIPDNRTIGTITMMMETYSHYKINHLTNYKTRIDIISQQLLETFNGQNIGGIGKLFFDRLGSINNKASEVGSVPFKGRWIFMSNKSG